MQGTKVSVINKSAHPLPEPATAGSAGVDLRAHLEETITLHPGQRSLVGTGLYLAIPVGFEVQVRPRSGLAYKHGITVLNSPGTIDSDYRGEIKVLLINHSDSPFEINNGDRIAQMILSTYNTVDWQLTDELDDTQRGGGGYGHTGKN